MARRGRGSSARRHGALVASLLLLPSASKAVISSRSGQPAFQTFVGCSRKRPRSSTRPMSFGLVMTAHDEAEDSTRTTLPASVGAAGGSAPAASSLPSRGLRMPSITDASLKRVREATSLTELVRNHVELRPVGHGAVGCCPFHDDSTPSFNVYEARGTYYCFGCNAGGDAFRFLMETERMTFGEAARLLAERAGIPLEYRGGPAAAAGTNAEERKELSHIMQLAAQFYARCLMQRPSAGGARAYLRERGVSPAACMSFQLGYSPANDDSPIVDYLLQEGFELPTLVEAGLLSNASASSIQRRSESGSYVARAGFNTAAAVGRRRDGARCVDRFRGRLVIPIRDHRGAVVAFGARDLGGSLAPAAAAVEAAAAAISAPVVAADEGVRSQQLLLRGARARLAKASMAAARAHAVQAAAAELAADLAAADLGALETATSGSAVAAATAAAAAAAAAVVQADKAKEAALKEVEAMAAALAVAPAASRARNPAAATSTVAPKKPTAITSKTHVAKYLNSPETPLFKKGQHVFGLDLAKESISEADQAIIVEGYFDVIALHEAGVRNVVGAMGTALTAEQLQLAARHARSRRVVLNLDGDKAGARAVERLCEGGAGSGRPAMLDTLAEAGVEVRVAMLPPDAGCKDPADFLEKHSAQEYRERVLGAAVPWTVWYGNRIISSAGDVGGADGDDAARRACVARFTGFLSRLSSTTERHTLAYRFAEVLAGGNDRLQIQLERDLVLEADAKARRQLALLRRVSDVAGLDSDAARMSAAAAAAAWRSGGGGAAAAAAAEGLSSQPPQTPQRKGQGSVLGTLTSGRATLGDDDVVASAGSRSSGRGGGGGSRADGKGSSSSGGGPQRRRNGDAFERAQWRPTLFGPSGVGASAETGKKWSRRQGRQDSLAFWEPIDYDADKLPQQQRQRWIAERQLLSLLLHDVKQRNEFLYLEEPPLLLPKLSTSQRQWLLDALAALLPDMRSAPASSLLEHFREVAPPGCFAPLEMEAAAVAPGATATGAAAAGGFRRRARSSNLEVLDGLFDEPVDAAAVLDFYAPRTAAAADEMSPALASQEAELRLQQLLLVIHRAEAAEELRRLFKELAEATTAANELPLVPSPASSAIEPGENFASAGSSGALTADEGTAGGNAVPDSNDSSTLIGSTVVDGIDSNGVNAAAVGAAVAGTATVEAAAARLNSLRKQVRDKLDYLGGLKVRGTHLEACMERLVRARARRKAAAADPTGVESLGAEAAALALAKTAGEALKGDEGAYTGLNFLDERQVAEADADGARFHSRLDAQVDQGAAAEEYIDCEKDGGGAMALGDDFDWDEEDLAGEEPEGSAFTAALLPLEPREHAMAAGGSSAGLREGGLLREGSIGGSNGDNGGSFTGGGGGGGGRSSIRTELSLHYGGVSGTEVLPSPHYKGTADFAADDASLSGGDPGIFRRMGKREANGRMSDVLRYMSTAREEAPGDHDSLGYVE